MHRHFLPFVLALSITVPAFRLSAGQESPSTSASTARAQEQAPNFVVFPPRGEEPDTSFWAIWFPGFGPDNAEPVQNAHPTQELDEDEGTGGDITKEKGYWAQRLYPGISIKPDAYAKAWEQWRRLPTAASLGSHPPRQPSELYPSKHIAMSSVSSLSGTTWYPYGPSPISEGIAFDNGRVGALAVNPNNPNVVYIGASGGGVWVSNNALSPTGATWTPLTDQQPSMGIGEPNDLAIDPNNTNTIYAGTSGRFVINITAGILKSTDGGGSWIVLGSGFPAGNNGNAQALFAGTNISSIIVDPANSNNLYLACDSGLYYSTDAGENWTLGNNGAVFSQSLVLDTSSPVAGRVLFAGSNGNGVLESFDGGQNWTQVLTNTSAGKVVVALAPPTSPPNPAGVQVVYAVLDTVGVFETTNQGASWTQDAASGFSFRTQGGFDLEIGVDPASPGDGVNDTLYIGEVGFFKSSDSASSFVNGAGPGGLHVDFHAKFAFVKQPSVPSVIYVGNDGGVFRSDDGGDHWTGTGQPGAPATLNGGSLQTGLIYNIDVKKDSTASVTLTALQDNGVVTSVGLPGGTDSIGGDGFSVAFDTVTTDNVYTTSGFWGGCGTPGIPCSIMFQSNTSGSSWNNLGACSGYFSFTIPNSEQDCVTAVPGTHPIRVDPTDSNYVYYGGVQDVWQTTNGKGTSFRNITNGNPSNRPTAIDIAPGNPNNVVVGYNGQVWLSTNAKAATVGPPSGVTFTNITENLPDLSVTRVLFDPNDPSTIYATLSGFSGFPYAHVFYTTIGAGSWTNISPPVDVPTNAIALDGGATPTTIYVGNDLGVLRSLDQGQTWAVLDGVHFPVVPVSDLVINEQAGVLRAATYGRGIFNFAPATGPVISVNAQNGLAFGEVCEGATSSLTLQIYNVGTSDLIVNSVYRLFGSTNFTIIGPSTPVTISPDAQVDFTVQYTGGGPADQATIRIATNDPNAPYYDLTATGSGSQPSINATVVNNGNFGSVCPGGQSTINLNVTNQSSCNLVISGIVTTTNFQPPTTVSYPLTLTADGTIALPLAFTPSTSQACSNTVPVTGTVTVFSNDPTQPLGTTLNLAGTVPCPKIASTIPNNGNFGTLCSGQVSDLNLEVLNEGQCNLNITSISSSSAQFALPTSPLTLSADANVDLPVAFQPAKYGSPGYVTCSNTVPETSNITIVSNDPTNPVYVVPVQGIEGCPTLVLGPLNLTGVNDYPPTVSDPTGTLGCYTNKQITVSNTGICPLIVANATTVNGLDGKGLPLPPSPLEYTVVNTPLPITVNPAATPVPITVRFKPEILTDQNPAAPTQQTGTLNLTSNDPVASDNTAALCGEPTYSSGARILLVNTLDNPISEVTELILTTTNITPPFTQTMKPGLLQPPVNICGNTVYYDLDNETLSPTGSNPNAYYRVLVKDNPHYFPPVDFRLTQCQYQQIVIVQKY